MSRAAVIDAHQHFWRHGARAHAWPAPAMAALARDFTPDDLRREMRAAGVDRTILMQSLNDAEETAEFLALAARTEWILGVVGWVPLTCPDRLALLLERMPHREHLIGIRHLINFEPDPHWLLRPEVQESVDVIAAHGLVFDAVPNDPIRLEAVLDTAARRPHMPVVIDHLARPPVDSGGWEPWATLIARAAALPNLRVKLSIGLDVALGWRWSTEALRPYVDHVLSLFGPGRVMAASNWPVGLLAGSYAELWAGTRGLLAGLGADERALVLGGAAARAFQIPQSAPVEAIQ
ncbi:amidohydrolase family protein [Muricoccus aerilatus]|uniref:amidohydrolase family protein n=1 Tax=Muricoccus aerilatus TaxID=452982 RepID=UPI0005C25607|nr:amidohydrolase family protein [Roseomonas aerilata]